MAIQINIDEFIQIAKSQDVSKFVSSDLAKKLAFLEEDDRSRVPKYYCPAVNFGDMDIFVDEAYRGIANDLIHHFWEGEMLIEKIGGDLTNYSLKGHKSIKFDYEETKRRFREAIYHYLSISPYDYPEIPLAYAYLVALGIPAMLVWQTADDLAMIWKSYSTGQVISR